MSSLGKKLKNTRELKEISLADIAQSTKISLKQLMFLEKGQWDALPGPFYIKGIIRAYAEAVGLDGNNLIELYLNESRNFSKTEKKKEAHPPKKKSGVSRTAVLGRVFVFLLFLAPSIFLIFHPYQPVNPPKTAHLADDYVPLERPLSLPQPDGFFMEIQIVEDTWLQVFADGEIQVEGLKKQGEFFSVIASNEIRLNLGNAGGIIYSLNNTRGKGLGPAGSVRRNIIINTENLGTFLKKGNGQEQIRNNEEKPLDEN